MLAYLTKQPLSCKLPLPSSAEATGTRAAMFEWWAHPQPQLIGSRGGLTESRANQVLLPGSCINVCGQNTETWCCEAAIFTLQTKEQRELGCWGEAWYPQQEGSALPQSNLLLGPSCIPAHRFHKISLYPCLLKQPKESPVTQCHVQSTFKYFPKTKKES